MIRNGRRGQTLVNVTLHVVLWGYTIERERAYRSKLVRARMWTIFISLSNQS